MSTPIKNTLFRFVTMRAPELSNENQKDKRFIFRDQTTSDPILPVPNPETPIPDPATPVPDPVAPVPSPETPAPVPGTPNPNPEVPDPFGPSHRVFDQAIRSRRGSVTKWQALQSAAAAFVPLTEATLKTSIEPESLDFAIWIARNKHSFDTTELLERSRSLSNLSTGHRLAPDTLTLLWNNLFYQVVTQKDFYVKETIIQLLVANHVAVNFEGADLRLLKQLKNAKVVLPKELFVEDNPTGNSSIARIASIKEEDKPFVSLPSEAMRRAQAVSLSNINIGRHNKLKKELLKVEQNYRKEYQKNYKNAQAEYKQAVKPILEAYHSKVREEKAKWISARGLNAAYDPNNPYDKPATVPQPELPEFNFEFRNEIDLNYLQPVLSVPAFETLLEVLEIKTESSGEEIESSLSTDTGTISYQDLYSMIDFEIAASTDVIIGYTPSQGNTSVSFGGVIISTEDDPVPVMPIFSYQVCPKTYSGSLTREPYVNFDLSFRVPDASWQVLGVETTVAKYSGEEITRTAFGESRNRNIIMLTDLHNDTLTAEDFYVAMRSLTIRITFTSGAKKYFTADFSNTLTCLSGYLTNILAETLTYPVPPIETPPPIEFPIPPIDPEPPTYPVPPVESENPIEPQPPTEEPVLPTDPPVPAPGTDGTFIPSGFGVKRLGIADYKKVEQTVQGYVEGDVAHIENIMAREYKDKATRRLRRSENTMMNSSESEREQLSDTTSTDRFEMQSEVAKVLQEGKDFSAGASFNADWGVYALGANVNMASHSSKEESNRQAITQAKEVTDRAMERIVTKVKQERIEKIVEEFEENNKHGFDNTKGDKHVVGVYRWVDKVYKNQVFNYGKRLMFEFMVPEPAKLHFLGMAENPMGTKLVKPDDPRTFADPVGTVVPLNMKDYNAVNNATVKYWGSKFNVELTPMKEPVVYTGKSISGDQTGSLLEIEYFSIKEEIKVPEGYQAVSANASLNAVDDNDQRNGKGVLVSVGDTFFNNTSKLGLVHSLETYRLISNFTDVVPVSATFGNYFSGSATISVRCELTSEARIKWQQETFKAIIDAYEKALVAYDQKVADENAKGNAIKEANKGFYRQIENMILRKNCISYIIDQNEAANRTYGKNMFKPLAPGIERKFSNHEVNVGPALDDYAAFSKFIEQAFEWDIMSYNFYPYYWGAKEDWPRLYQYDNNDPLFKSFMQAGMARVVVTVRPGFEDAVSYYMQTGQIWNGGEVPVIEDKLFMSIVDELRQPEGQKEGKAWATRLPTALTILQAQTIGLNVTKALPFDENLTDFEDPESVPQSAGLGFSDAQLGTSQKGRIVGKITGNQSREAKVVLKNLDGTIRDLTYCDANGNWELNDIPVAKYQLLLDANNDFPAAQFEVIEGSKEQTIEFSGNQTLEINLTLRPVAQAIV
ncbi:MAG TPA: hypothetical protein VF677_01160 [Flavobacterium sp.]|jgi:hypothetical protein